MAQGDSGKFERLLDSIEAAGLLGINSHTLQRMARAGDLPGIKIGKLWRFRRSALDKWLDSKVGCLHHPCRE
jgi:excisionase family DNA binding protein